MVISAFTKTDSAFAALLSSAYVLTPFRHHGIATKSGYYEFMLGYNKTNAADEGLKAVLILVTQMVLRNWAYSERYEKQKSKLPRKNTLVLVYFLSFIFFCINICYFIYFLSAEWSPLLMPLAFIVLLVGNINVLIWRFYDVGNRFSFEKIADQEIQIFKHCFVQGISRGLLKNTPAAEDDFFNEKYLLLKDEYKRKFFVVLKQALLEKLFSQLKSYALLYFVFQLVSVNDITFN